MAHETKFPSGAPGSAIRNEFEAWREVSRLIRLIEAQSSLEVVDAGRHDKNCTCDFLTCLLYRAIREWGVKRAVLACLDFDGARRGE